MRRLRNLCLLLTFLLLSINITTVFAQNYSFTVPAETVDLYINQDGTASIDYLITFDNDIGSHEIDFVDIGLPSTNYDMSSITAHIEGNPITDIEPSSYVDGIALGLGEYAIPPGGSSTVYVHIGTIKNMLYFASSKEEEEYASFQFVPNYFGSDFVHSTTEMIVNIHMPPGLTENEPRYFPPSNWAGSKDPASGYDEEGQIVYQWYAENADASARYEFGGSFPARLVPLEAINTQQSVSAQKNINLPNVFPIICCGSFIAIFILAVAIIAKINKKRKLKYLPPKIAIEGHGIKRGLTAVEAAVLMEHPMDKILTMILFSSLKKEAAKVIKQEPLKIEVEEPLPEGLRKYEREFLEAYKLPNSRARRKALQDMMISLVKSVSQKMKGFSRKETTAYYKDIIKRAWAQVEAAKTPEVGGERYQGNMDWTMMDQEYDQRTRRVFGSGPMIMPWWWWRADPKVRPVSRVGGASRVSTATIRPSGSKSTTINLPSLPGSNAAASVVNTVQAFSAGVVGNIAGFTSGVTNKTNPILKTTSTKSFRGGSSRGGGFSGGCACACACAGCACACAGGGR